MLLAFILAILILSAKLAFGNADKVVVPPFQGCGLTVDVGFTVVATALLANELFALSFASLTLSMSDNFGVVSEALGNTDGVSVLEVLETEGVPEDTPFVFLFTK